MMRHSIIQAEETLLANRRSVDGQPAPPRQLMATWAVNASLGILVAGLVVVALLIARQNAELRNLVKSLQSGSQVIEAGMIGKVLPNVRLRDLDGNVVSLSSVLGGRSGVVAYFATTCPYCKQTVPAWHDLAGELARDGAAFVAVSLNDAQATRAYVRNSDIEFPVYLVDGPAARRALSVSAVPLTVTIAEDRTVVEARRGVLRAGDPTRIAAALRER